MGVIKLVFLVSKYRGIRVVCQVATLLKKDGDGVKVPQTAKAAVVLKKINMEY